MGSLGRSSLFALGVTALVLALWPAAASAKRDQVTLEGTLLVKHADVFRERKAEYWYWLQTKHGRVKLTFSSKLPETLGKARARVRGSRSATVVHVNRIRVLAPARTLASRTSVSGPLKLAVILFGFQGSSAQPPSVAQANTNYFGGS